jgi:C4-dicarboxylate transporter, DctM subunit
VRVTALTSRSRGSLPVGDRFAVSLIASSGAIAVVIPPSISMILCSMSAQQSAVALFAAGLFPLLMIGLVNAL